MNKVEQRAWELLEAECGKPLPFDVPVCAALSAVAAALSQQPEAQQPAPPSAPVGVEAIAAEIRASLGRGATVSTRRRWAVELEALAQQPAAVGGDFINRIADSLIEKGWDIDPNCDGTGVTQLREAVISVLAAKQQGGAM